MKPEEYWAKRMEALNEAMLAKGEEYIRKQNEEYEKALARIRAQTERWYARLAKNNDISLAEARKLLDKNELKEFHWTVEEYIQRGRENAVDQRWMKELENVSAKVHITRLQELETHLRQQIELLAAKKQKGAAETLGGVYKDSYYKSVYELQKGTGVGSSFAKLDDRQIDKVLSKPWAPDGSNFSARIWADRTKLVNELQTILTQDLIRGEPAEKVIADFAERMNVSKHAAARLIRTEAAYFSGQSRLDAYREMGVERYKFVATLDMRTSEICRGMDGKVFLIGDAKPGVNYPPLHVFCRSTTIPYYEDAAAGERAAKDDEGKTYMVPGDMTYKEWAAKHAPEAKDTPKSVEPKPVITPETRPASVGEPPPVGNGMRRYNPKASYYIELPGISDDVLEIVAETNRRIAKEGYKESREILVAINNETGEIISELRGSIDEVVFNEKLDEILRSAAASSVIITHNHPKGTRINVKDIRNLSVYQSLSHIVAVGHDGGISAVGSAGNWVDIVAFNTLFRRIIETVNARLESDEEYATMSVAEQRAYFEYLVLQEIVDELGWVYVEDFTVSRTGNWGIR
jgi:SPP1 gp7 family putative phage head morphogenesis protein